jgi:hypothetical protein
VLLLLLPPQLVTLAAVNRIIGYACRSCMHYVLLYHASMHLFTQLHLGFGVCMFSHVVVSLIATTPPVHMLASLHACVSGGRYYFKAEASCI